MKRQYVFRRLLNQGLLPGSAMMVVMYICMPLGNVIPRAHYPFCKDLKHSWAVQKINTVTSYEGKFRRSNHFCSFYPIFVSIAYIRGSHILVYSKQHNSPRGNIDTLRTPDILQLSVAT